MHFQKRDAIVLSKQKVNGALALKDERLLDETGWSILRELQKDARLSFPELGRRVGLSTPVVAERVRKLEDAGVITGYGARVDPAKVGLPIMAFVRITTTPQTETGLRGLIAELPELLECHRVTGNESFLVKLVVRRSISAASWRFPQPTATTMPAPKGTPQAIANAQSARTLVAGARTNARLPR